MVTRLILVAITLAYLTLNGYFLNYVSHLEASGCQCAHGWRRTFLQVSFAVFVALNIISLTGWQASVPWVVAALFAFQIAYVVITRQFIMHVQKEQCSCAQTTALRVLNIVNYITIGLMALTAVLVIATLFGIVRKNGSGTSAQPDAAPRRLTKASGPARMRSGSRSGR